MTQINFVPTDIFRPVRMKDVDLPVERSMTDMTFSRSRMTNRAGEQCQHYHACGDTTCSDMGLESCSSRSGEGAGPSGVGVTDTKLP